MPGASPARAQSLFASRSTTSGGDRVSGMLLERADGRTRPSKDYVGPAPRPRGHAGEPLPGAPVPNGPSASAPGAARWTRALRAAHDRGPRGRGWRDPADDRNSAFIGTKEFRCRRDAGPDRPTAEHRRLDDLSTNGRTSRAMGTSPASAIARCDVAGAVLVRRRDGSTRRTGRAVHARWRKVESRECRGRRSNGVGPQEGAEQLARKGVPADDRRRSTSQRAQRPRASSARQPAEVEAPGAGRLVPRDVHRQASTCPARSRRTSRQRQRSRSGLGRSCVGTGDAGASGPASRGSSPQAGYGPVLRGRGDGSARSSRTGARSTSTCGSA